MFTEDLSAFLRESDFAVAAVYNGGTTVLGIFDNEYAPVPGAGVATESTQPVFWCAAADVAGVTHGIAITILGVAYQVAGVEPDGTGLVRLVLEKQ